MTFFSILSKPDCLVQVVTVIPKIGKAVLESNKERVLQLCQYSQNHNEKKKSHFGQEDFTGK